MKIVLACLLVLFVAASASAQTPTYVKPAQSLSLAWDADTTSQPPVESHKVRMLTESSPTSVTIKEILTNSPANTFAVPYTVLPDQTFYVSVRALRTVNEPGESGDSNVIGPFVKSTSVRTPTGLSGTVVPTP